MNTIGTDCQNIIIGYKQQLEDFEEHKLNFRATIETISNYNTFINEIVRINYRFLRWNELTTRNCYVCHKIILTEYQFRCEGCRWRCPLLSLWCEFGETLN
jgi:hypothetical protein